MSVKIIDNILHFDRQTIQVFDAALGRMAKDIVQVAKIRVPYKDGDLQDSIESEKRGLLRHRVVAKKKYASYQERGMRQDGSHAVRKYTTPNTGKHYLQQGGDKVKENALNYLKQANQLIRL